MWIVTGMNVCCCNLGPSQALASHLADLCRNFGASDLHDVIGSSLAMLSQVSRLLRLLALDL